MGISQQIGASSLIKPGVIDSSAARPASPYEGQVIFQKDTDQLLVWNGTAWVIPNSPAQNPGGLDLITTAALSGVSTNFVGCFSSTYSNYRIVCGDLGTSSSPDLIGFRMLSGTTPATTNFYYTAITSYNSSGTAGSITAAPTSLGYFIRVLGSGSSVPYQSFAYDISNPFAVSPTFFTGNGMTVGTGGNYTSFSGGVAHDNFASYNGIQILTGGGSFTMAGNVSIYGYRK